MTTGWSLICFLFGWVLASTVLGIFGIGFDILGGEKSQTFQEQIAIFILMSIVSFCVNFIVWFC